MSTRNWIATAVAAVLFSGMSATAALASTAGGTPTPTPTYTTPSPTPTPTSCPLVVNGIPQPITPGTDLALCRGIRQEDFWLDINAVNPNGSVLATGPVFFRVGRDTSISPTLDRFHQFINSVNVFHAALSGAVVDRAACTITLDQNDLTWRFIRGTGFYRRALGAGVYDLRGEFSFPTKDFVCSLPVSLSSGQAAWDLNHGGSGLPAPLGFDIGVNATGWASLVPFPTVPSPSPSPTYWAPTNS
jgi:hypothetical protein